MVERLERLARARPGGVLSNIPMLILGVRELSILLCRDFSQNTVTQSGR